MRWPEYDEPKNKKAREEYERHQRNNRRNNNQNRDNNPNYVPPEAKPFQEKPWAVPPAETCPSRPNPIGIRRDNLIELYIHELSLILRSDIPHPTEAQLFYKVYYPPLVCESIKRSTYTAGKICDQCQGRNKGEIFSGFFRMNKHTKKLNPIYDTEKNLQSYGPNIPVELYQERGGNLVSEKEIELARKFSPEDMEEYLKERRDRMIKNCIENAIEMYGSAVGGEQCFSGGPMFGMATAGDGGIFNTICILLIYLYYMFDL